LESGLPAIPRPRARSSTSTGPLKHRLGRGPAARTLGDLQARLDAFRLAHDEQRPQPAVGRVTPGEACRATPRAMAAGFRADS
jgi:hypothetical protein